MEYDLLSQTTRHGTAQPVLKDGSRFRAARESRHRKASIMSCRIDRVVSGGDLVVFRVSGRITAQELGMLQDLLLKESGAVAIDLKDVLLVDLEAVKLLAFSEVNGVELRNCHAYIREWISRERVQSRPDGSRQATRASEDIEDV
jgi:hypothetical protein